MPCRLARVFRSVENHDSSVCTHGGEYVGVLRLISGLVNLPFVVNSLYDIEFDLHYGRFLRGSTPVSADLLAFFVIVCRIRRDWLGKLHLGYLYVILGFIGGVCTNQESVRRVVFVRKTAKVSRVKALPSS